MSRKSAFAVVGAVAWSVLMLACAEAAEEPAQPPAPAGKWEFLPEKIKGALVGMEYVIGPGEQLGEDVPRCFYEVSGEPAAELSASEDGMVAPGFRPLLFDSRGWLWCLGPKGDAIFAVRGKEVMKVTPPKGAVFETLGESWGVEELGVTIFEDAGKWVWIGDSRGVQWFDGEKWGQKDLADPRGIELVRPMSRLKVSADAEGRLYFWASESGEQKDGNRMFARGPYCGTDGFWMFDGKEWESFTVRDRVPAGRIEAVLPMGADRVLLKVAEKALPVPFSMKRVDIAAEVAWLVKELNSPEFAVREKATQSLEELGAGAGSELKKFQGGDQPPEVRWRIKMVLDALSEMGDAQQSGLFPGLDGKKVALEIDAQKLDHGPWLCVIRSAREANDDNGREDQVCTWIPTHAGVGIQGFHVLCLVIQDWPGVGRGERVSGLGTGRGDLWIGIEHRGLFHWDGKKTVCVSDERTREFWRVFGKDERGRILVGDGKRVAAYLPEAADDRK